MDYDVLTCDAGPLNNGTFQVAIVRGAQPLTIEAVEGDINEAELRGVLVATRFATAPRGIILSDSTSAVKAMVEDWPWHPRARHPDEWRALALEVRAAMPAGWLVAWVPRQLTRPAHNALAQRS